MWTFDTVVYGIQPTTLLDYPGKVATTLFFSGCNMKCPFCHNRVIAESDIDAGIYKRKHIIENLNDPLWKRLRDGVVFSGGEALMNPRIIDFMKEVKDLGYLVKLDTNGLLPDKLEEAINEGAVDYVAMDIKSSPGNYSQACGLKSVPLSVIHNSVGIVMDAGNRGLIDYEFRTTAVDELHDENDFEQIGRFIEGAEKYYIQAFVDGPDVPCRGFHAPDRIKLQRCLEAVRRHVKRAEARGWME